MFSNFIGLQKSLKTFVNHGLLASQKLVQSQLTFWLVSSVPVIFGAQNIQKKCVDLCFQCNLILPYSWGSQTWTCIRIVPGVC